MRPLFKNIALQYMVRNMVWSIRNTFAKYSEKSAVYSTIQRLVGAHKMYMDIVASHIVPNQQHDTLIIDIGCGTADIVAYIPNRIDYIGLDNNHHYIESAKKRYPHRDFYHIDVTQHNLQDNIPSTHNIFLLIGVLHHLTDQEATHILSTLHTHMKKGDMILSVDGCQEANISAVENFFYQVDRGKHIRCAKEYVSLFPTTDITWKIHREWLRVPYRHVVCVLHKSM